MKNLFPALVIVLLLICLLASAGCTSIPGPDVRFTPSMTKTPEPVTPQVKAPTLKATTAPVIPVTTVGVTTTVTTPAGRAPAAYEVRTCAAQGGFTVTAGEQCPGSWLTAADTFNCCSLTPVRETGRNETVTVEPFDLVIVMNDDPGSILP